MQTIHEAARDVTVAGSYDVVIAGAGPSGIAAALASARTGASTLLLEGQGCLGGVWTAGLLSWIIDAGGKQGIMTELFEAIDSGGLRTVMQSDTYATAYDPEMMKRLLERLCLKAGIRIRLHTWLVSAELNDEGRLTHVVTESKSGPEAWAGRVLVDCTGDGDLAARAGCGFDFGHPGTGQTQPSSLLGLLGGPALEDVRPFLSGGSDGAFASENKRRLRELLTELGVAPSYASASLFPIHDGLYMFMANHEYGVKATDADDITRATLQARSEVHAMATALGRHDGPFSGARLVATAEQIGVREGRRIHGLHTVSVDEMIRGARHTDAICRVNFGIDVHSTDPAKSKSHNAEDHVRTQPYDIPLRALVAKDVEGLLMAGRCISGDFLAHSSYRVTGNAVALGEAAGFSAARSSQLQIQPSKLPFEAIAQELTSDAPQPSLAG